MEPQQKELTLEESVKQVMQTLPPVLRNYLASGKYSLVAKNLMTKYGLHIDQGTVLEREIMLLLMGIENPDEFANALKTDALISEDVMRSITTDVNQEIFVPLRKQMQNEATKPAASAQPTPQSRIVRPMTPTVARVNAPMPSYVPPRPSPIHEAEPRGNAPWPTLPPPLRATPKAMQDTAPMVIPQMPSQSVQKLASSLHDVIKEVTAKATVSAPNVPAPLPPKMAMPNMIPPTRPGHPTNLLVGKPPVPTLEVQPSLNPPAGGPKVEPRPIPPPLPHPPRPVQLPQPPVRTTEGDPYRESVE